MDLRGPIKFSAVSNLLRVSGPSYVSGLIAAFIVYSVKAVLLARLPTYMRKESIEVTHPLAADRYASPTIILPILMTWPSAAVFHRSPSIELRSLISRISGGRSLIAHHLRNTFFDLQASARPRLSVFESAGQDIPFCPAIAFAET